MDDAKTYDELTVTFKVDLENRKVSLDEFRLVQTHLSELLELMLQENNDEE